MTSMCMTELPTQNYLFSLSIITSVRNNNQSTRVLTGWIIEIFQRVNAEKIRFLVLNKTWVDYNFSRCLYKPFPRVNPVPKMSGWTLQLNIAFFVEPESFKTSQCLVTLRRRNWVSVLSENADVWISPIINRENDFLRRLLKLFFPK